MTLAHHLVKFHNGHGHIQTCSKKKLYVVTKHSDVMKAALKQFKIYKKNN